MVYLYQKKLSKAQWSDGLINFCLIIIIISIYGTHLFCIKFNICLCLCICCNVYRNTSKYVNTCRVISVFIKRKNKINSRNENKQISKGIGVPFIQIIYSNMIDRQVLYIFFSSFLYIKSAILLRFGGINNDGMVEFPYTFSSNMIRFFYFFAFAIISSSSMYHLQTLCDKNILTESQSILYNVRVSDSFYSITFTRQMEKFCFKSIIHT